MLPKIFDTPENIDVLVEHYDLIVHNDDVHTFDFVIDTLMEICNHSYEQAVQCTYIIHYKGKCSVKRGTFEELKPKCDAIRERGLSATIE